MKILVIGATGTIGESVRRALEGKHEVLQASHSRSALRVDLADPDSIRNLYAKTGRLDAVVSVAGQAAFRPLIALSDADFDLSLKNKLMGQVNVVRLGIDSLADKGSFTLTSGNWSRYPVPGSAAVSLVNSGIEGFVRAAVLELPRGLRINGVAPALLRETLIALKNGSKLRPAGRSSCASLRESRRREHDRPDPRRCRRRRGLRPSPLSPG
jgi:NAD(P)-dependent dehydrogenase (short-subunit alcohol dehydrogenase family)